MDTSSQVAASEISQPSTSIEGAVDWYAKSAIVRALAQLVPFGIGSAADVLLAERYGRIIQKRRRQFFEELDREGRALSSAVIESDDFIHCFDVTLRAVHRTHREQKIRLFARLFRAASDSSNGVDIDEYEELLRILDELSVKDLKVLMALEEYEITYYKDGSFPDTDRFEGAFHKIAARALGVDEERLSDGELRGVVVRLNRTGCYALMGWRKGPARDCSLTGIYFRLRQLVQNAEGKLL